MFPTVPDNFILDAMEDHSEAFTSMVAPRAEEDPVASMLKRLPGFELPTLPETNMETQKGPYKDYSPLKGGPYGFPC